MNIPSFQGTVAAALLVVAVCIALGDAGYMDLEKVIYMAVLLAPSAIISWCGVMFLFYMFDYRSNNKFFVDFAAGFVECLILIALIVNVPVTEFLTIKRGVSSVVVLNIQLVVMVLVWRVILLLPRVR